MPPPAPLGPLPELPVIVLFVMFIGPFWTLRMPPPNPAELLLRASLMMLTVAVLLLRIPPPEEPAGTLPFEMVKPENVTTPGLAAVTLKTRLLLFPLIVK